MTIEALVFDMNLLGITSLVGFCFVLFFRKYSILSTEMTIEALVFDMNFLGITS